MGAIEIIQLKDAGFCPLVDFESWRVGALQYNEKFQEKNLCALERHDETDEVFVLLKGTCLLFDGGSGEAPEGPEVICMEPLKVYNVKMGTWHIHMLSEDGVVLVVENADTRRHNTSESLLFDRQREWMRTVCSENSIPV